MAKQISNEDFKDLCKFYNLTRDNTLNSIFYPTSEYFSDNQTTGATLLTSGPHCHPLHPEFKPILKNNLIFGLYGISDEKHAQPINLDKKKEELLKAQKIRIDAHWKEVRNHRFYMEIYRYAGFKKAIDCLRRKIRLDKAGGYSHPYTEFRFIRIALEQIVFFTSNGRRGIPEATAADKRAALSHIKKIEGDFYNRGIKFNKSTQLLNLLNELRQEIELSKSIRAERSDEISKPYRDLTNRLCDELLNNFYEASPTLLQHLLSIVEPKITKETILNRVNKNSKRRLA